MSHITTTTPAGRAGFDALPQSNATNGDLDTQQNFTNTADRADEPQHNLGSSPDDSSSHYDVSRRPSQEYESSSYYGDDRSLSSRRTDYTRVPTAYQPEMITSDEYVGIVLDIERERPNYRPSALRWPFLASLLIVILTLVGLVAYALQSLPLHYNDFNMFDKRSLDSFDNASLADYAGTKRIITVVNIVGRADTTTASGATTASQSQTMLFDTSTPAKENFGNVGTQVVTEIASPSKTTTMAPLPTDPQYSKDETDFGKVGQPVTISEAPPAETSLGLPATTNHGNAGTVTISETVSHTTVQAKPPTFVAPPATTLTNSAGVPTATWTETPEPVSTPQTTTLTDWEGRPTATQETHVLLTPSVTVETDSAGIPTATATLFPVLPSPDTDDNDNENGSDTSTSVIVRTYSITYGQYFIGMFLPTVLAIALAIPVRILDTNAKLFQPWHELATATPDAGALGKDSLCLDTSGWQSLLTSLRSLLGGQALLFLTSFLVLVSAVLVPASAEAVAFDLRGAGCVRGGGSAANCAYVLSVFDQAAKATAVLLALMAVAVVLVLVLVVLRRWRSGVATNPWSICGAAALALNPELRRLLIGAGAGGGSGIGDEAAGVPKGMLESVLAERRFKLGYFYGPNGTVEYGIMLHGKLPRGNRESFLSDQYDDLKDPLNQPARTEPKQHLPFLMLGIAGRVVFLFLLCGLLALILTYANTGGKTAFEDFMDSESFGVRFLFTSVGVIISFFWAGFFGSIATLSPYQLLAKSPQKAHRSILLAPPTNAFSGLWSAIRRRDLFLAIVAFTSILSEFLTVALSNIPFRVTQTFLAHTVCMWLAVSILCVMVLVVLASFFLLAAWPHMPVDPGTIAGAMYYVCDSWMLVRMEGLSTLKRRDRDWRVNQMGLRYEFGEIRGADSGVVRVGVDASTASMAAAKGTSWAL